MNALLKNLFTSSSGYGGGGSDQQCECDQLNQHNKVILAVTIPIIALYLVLLVVGISNVLRF